MKLTLQCLVIALAGGLGAVARFLVVIGCARWLGTGFPIGTFVINITGSFLLGWILTAGGHRLGLSPIFQLAIASGFLGAYTTFSTFMYESNALWSAAQELKAMVNLLGSVVVGLAAVRLGMLVGRA